MPRMVIMVVIYRVEITNTAITSAKAGGGQLGNFDVGHVELSKSAFLISFACMYGAINPRQLGTDRFDTRAEAGGCVCF